MPVYLPVFELKESVRPLAADPHFEVRSGLWALTEDSEAGIAGFGGGDHER